MAKVTITTIITLMDYFDKWGFDEGTGAAESAAWDFMTAAIESLNNAFRKYNLPLKASRYEVDSCHNNVRLALHATEGGAEIYTGEDDLDHIENHGIDLLVFKNAMEEASLLFEAKAGGDVALPLDKEDI